MAELIEQTNDKLVIRKLIPASREEVFAAWSDPESIRHWMCPGDAKTAEAQRSFGRLPSARDGKDRRRDHKTRAEFDRAFRQARSAAEEKA